MSTNLSLPTLEHLAFTEGLPIELDHAASTAHVVMDGREFVASVGRHRGDVGAGSGVCAPKHRAGFVVVAGGAS